MTLPDQVLIFLTLVDKVVVYIYAIFQFSIKHICKDIHSSIQIYEESRSAILFLLLIAYKREFLMSSGQNMFTKGQSGELAWVTSSNIPSPLKLFLGPFSDFASSLLGKTYFKRQSTDKPRPLEFALIYI